MPEKTKGQEMEVTYSTPLEGCDSGMTAFSKIDQTCMFPVDICTERIAQNWLTGIIPKSATWQFGRIPKGSYLDWFRLLRTKN